MDISDVVKAAIPDANDAVVDFIIWNRTPFPFKHLTFRYVYKIASGFHRATQRHMVLCDLCHRVAMPGRHMCFRCSLALRSVPK